MINDINKKNKQAFTLIEMLIVVSILGILLSTIFSIIFVVLRQQARIYRIVEARRQGDTIMNFMKERIIRADIIRNRVAIPRPPLPAIPPNTPQCSPTFTTFAPANSADFLLEDTTTQYRFFVTGGNLVYNELPTAVNTPLNNNRVRITGFTIECILKATLSTPIVQFTYTVTFPSANPAEPPVVLVYRSKVKLR